MVQNITISNFFSIREPLEVSFEASKEKQYSEDWIIKIGNFRLLKAILLYGANGSGKTNLLCALDFLRHTILNVPAEADQDLNYMRFALDPTYRHKNTEFDLHFFIGGTRYRYRLELTPKRILEEELRVYHNGNLSRAVYTRKFNEDKGVNIVRFGTWMTLSPKDRKTIEEATTANLSVLTAFITRNISCEELTKVRNYFKQEFFRLYNVADADQEVAKAIKEDSNLKLLLLDLLQTFHSNIVDVESEEETRQIPEEARQFLMQMNISESEKNVIANLKSLSKWTSNYIHKTQLGEFALSEDLQSEGTKSFIRHLALFYKALKGNWLIALDEFGSGMQAKTQHLLLDFFLKFSRGSQLIFATQSLGFLDFPTMRRDAIQIVSKDRRIGQTQIDANTIRSIHKNIKLRKAYNDGRFTTIDPNEPDFNLSERKNQYQSLIFNFKQEGGDV
ncbi:MAG: AAA family ATPase [Bacteroidales bacterium]|nr:AAA family ATPase [Bacteroidales bacterium]